MREIANYGEASSIIDRVRAKLYAIRENELADALCDVDTFMFGLSTSPDRQRAIPEGWQLVPKLATLEMEKAAVARVKPYHDEDWYRVMPKDLFRLAWKALLSASPSPPPAATGGEVTPQMIEAFRAARDAASEWCGCYDPGQHRHYITTGRDEVWSLASEDYVTGHFAMMEELDRIRIKHALSAAISSPKQEG